MLVNVHVERQAATLGELEQEIKKRERIVGVLRHSADCVGARRAYPPTVRMGHRVIQAARRRGVILRPLGNVLVLMPPLAIADDELGLLLDVTRDAIVEATES